MADMDSLDYLQTGFDPASLTVPRLRSILVSHNIPYPASAKKSQLIDIFTENVVPQAHKILSARARAKRTSKGITDADSQDNISLVDEEIMPPPSTTRPRSTRKPSSRAKLDDSESEMRTTRSRSPVKRTPRASSKHARAPESETGTDLDVVTPKVRKTRKSEAIPRPVPVLEPDVKDEPNDDIVLPKRPVDASVFSYDNPFQSGSSPASGARSPSGERRRKSTPSAASKELARRKSASTTRRRTEGPKADDNFHPPTSATFEIPVSELNGLTDYDENGVEAGEDFTPEAQMELVRERSANGLNALGPRRPKRKQAAQYSKAGPIWAVLLTLLCGYAFKYRQEKIAVGYCGIGRLPKNFVTYGVQTPEWSHQIVPETVQLPDWAIAIAEPQCEPCPQHAVCYPKFETRCDPDYVLKHHPLSLGGLVPIPPTCEPDGEKARRVKAVADRAIEELRERRAKWECGDLVDEKGAPESSVEIDADDLKKEMSKKRRKGMGTVEFEELWLGAIGEIKGREEVESRADGAIIKLSSSSLARLPYVCAIKRSARLAVARHRLGLTTLGAFIGLILYVRHALTARAVLNAAIPDLVSLTLDRLATQQSLHLSDKESYPEPWIAIGQLRDDVLRDEHSIAKREIVWKKVRKVVEMNANVRAAQREGRNGEVSRVWEWIGAVPDASERRRKSGRVSWGAYGENGSSPVSGSDGGAEMVQQKWLEGRPIY
ncbi:hypothetical protein BP6252_02681 [Coleophoma cylindrospora]|uniref:Sister chromatid separation protein-like protein n=1 Tax=Coleophoma cylindrospora TaxID=1849047 RepID=A0A3D8SFW5_9HELO|nr:hypothetical protein BP6252_02681 [Coleophoma cylindrospora]